MSPNFRIDGSGNIGLRDPGTHVDKLKTCPPPLQQKEKEKHISRIYNLPIANSRTCVTLSLAFS